MVTNEFSLNLAFTFLTFTFLAFTFLAFTFKIFLCVTIIKYGNTYSIALFARGQGGAGLHPPLPPSASRTQKRRGIDASWKSFQLYHNSHDADYC